jgi:hypothetical protein
VLKRHPPLIELVEVLRPVAKKTPIPHWAPSLAAARSAKPRPSPRSVACAAARAATQSPTQIADRNGSCRVRRLPTPWLGHLSLEGFADLTLAAIAAPLGVEGAFLVDAL